MRACFRSAVVAGLIFLATGVPRAGSAATSDICPSWFLLVPAYSYPEPGSMYWTALADAARRVPLTAIVNPADGPGTSVDPNYTAAIDSLHAAGGRAIGYVYTSYGARSLTLVLADLDRFALFYPLEGFFVDEMPTDTSAAVLDYYAAIYGHVKMLDPGFWVVGNPGTNTEEVYLTRPTADALVTFEDSDGYGAYVPSAWVFTYPPDRFVHLVYGVPSADSMTSVMLRAAGHNVTWVNVTNDVLPNPWDSLPPYWEEEVRSVECAAVPRDSGPLRASTALAVRAHPLPARLGQDIHIEVSAREAVSVWVADFQGRRILDLADGPLAPGSHRFRWSGADGSGRAVPPGIYLAIARAAREQRAARVLVLR